jgi:hypothetical protein
VLHSAAESVLVEFGDLHIGTVGTGIDLATSDILVNPTVALGEDDRFYDYFPPLKGKALFPLGEVHRGHAFLAIDANGEVFELMDEVYCYWRSFGSALEALLLGLRSEPVPLH